MQTTGNATNCPGSQLVVIFQLSLCVVPQLAKVFKSWNRRQVLKNEWAKAMLSWNCRQVLKHGCANMLLIFDDDGTSLLCLVGYEMQQRLSMQEVNFENATVMMGL